MSIEECWWSVGRLMAVVWVGVTAVVSLLHIVFDMLAFKASCTHLLYCLRDPLWQNDIQFWRNNKSLQGLSLQKIRTDVVVSVIAT